MNVKYIVKEEQGIVVAVVKGCRRHAMQELEMVDLVFSSDYYISDSYSGVARCMPEDTFDLEYGKKLAKSRCLKKYYSAKFAKINMYTKRLMEKTNDKILFLNRKMVKNCDMYNKEFKDIIESDYC